MSTRNVQILMSTKLYPIVSTNYLVHCCYTLFLPTFFLKHCFFAFQYSKCVVASHSAFELSSQQTCHLSLLETFSLSLSLSHTLTSKWRTPATTATTSSFEAPLDRYSIYTTGLSSNRKWPSVESSMSDASSGIVMQKVKSTSTTIVLLSSRTTAFMGMGHAPLWNNPLIIPSLWDPYYHSVILFLSTSNIS